MEWEGNLCRLRHSFFYDFLCYLKSLNGRFKKQNNNTMEKHKNPEVSNFKLGQLFGSKESANNSQDEDLISVIRFDKTGNYLALGDHAGRVIIFQNQANSTLNYEYFAEFQAYTYEFDPLKGNSIDEKLKSIQWLRSQDRYLKMITSNSKSIRVWKIFEKTTKKLAKCKDSIPKVNKSEPEVIFQQQKTLPSFHSSEILSIQPSANQQFLLSSDSMVSLLWNLEKPQNPYIVNRIQPQCNDTSLTSLKIHPSSDNIFAYGTSLGTLHFSDMRCPLHYKAINFNTEKKKSKKVYDDISKISGISFLQNGKYIVVRDYLTVKVWDVTNSKNPVSSMMVEEALKNKLCQLFEQDCIQDNFPLTTSNKNDFILTGNYNNHFHLINSESLLNCQYELNYGKETRLKQMTGEKVGEKRINPKLKTMAYDWHPKYNMLAIASKNSFFTYLG